MGDGPADLARSTAEGVGGFVLHEAERCFQLLHSFLDFAIFRIPDFRKSGFPELHNVDPSNDSW